MSDGELARRAKELFLEAAELAASERDAFLDAACRDEPGLRERVAGLLEAHAAAEDAFEDSDDWQLEKIAPAALSASPQPGQRVGAYRLVRPLGEGGFGTVWLADQREPVRRRVAVKILKAGLDTREVVLRFEAERQALALMDHPNIARVFDGGATEQGRPWFAMELVHGVPLTQYATERELVTRERLELFLQVCAAVQHAHQKGVIHRDLKPGNVLVSEVDGAPVAHVIDFGVAKAVQEPLTPATLQTQFGQMVGTPVYMSPEQIAGSEDIDTRTDVWALGVMLYELLCGSTPYQDSGIDSAALPEVQRLVREVDPPRPSTRLGRDTTLRIPVTTRAVKGDLDWIVMCCLEKDRERRYDSAAVLANDVRRHLQGEPVLAGPPSLTYRLRKLAQRHKSILAVTALIMLVLLAGFLVSRSQAKRAQAAEVVSREEAERARLELRRSTAVSGFLEHVLQSLDPRWAQGKDIELLRDVLDRADVSIGRGDWDHPPEVEASLRRIIGGAYFSLALYESAEEQFERAHQLARVTLGERDPISLQIRHELGATQLRLGKLEQAEANLASNLSDLLAVHGPKADLVLEARGHMAVLRQNQQRYDEAIALFEALEADYTELRGADHADTILTTNNLAGVLTEVGRTAEARERYERALELQIEVLHEDHPKVLAALNNMGFILLEEQRAAEAKPYLERALAVKERILARGHPSTVTTKVNLATVASGQRHFDEAERLYREAFEESREHSGEADGITLRCQYGLANFYMERSRTEEAEDLFAGIVDVANVHDRLGDPTVIDAQSELGYLLLKRGLATEAEALIAEATERAEDVYPSSHPKPGIFRVRHGLSLRAAGRHAEAIGALEAGFERLRETNEAVWLDRAVRSLIELHGARGDAAAARAWTERLP